MSNETERQRIFALMSPETQKIALELDELMGKASPVENAIVTITLILACLPEMKDATKCDVLDKATQCLFDLGQMGMLKALFADDMVEGKLKLSIAVSHTKIAQQVETTMRQLTTIAAVELKEALSANSNT